MSPNRIVAVLTPLVFAPAAGAICAYLAQNFPGVEIDPGSLQQIFVAGAAIALVPAAQWLHGWQKHEQRLSETERDVALANAGAQAAIADAEPVALPDDGSADFAGFDDFGDLGDLDGFDGDAFAELDEAAAPAEG
jgi:hypothetical protein